MELEGRGPTAIVTSGLVNARVVFKLINEYSTSATGRSNRIRLIELTYGGMLKLAAIARREVTWHFGLEDLELIALDVETKGDQLCSERSSRQQETPNSSTTSAVPNTTPPRTSRSSNAAVTTMCAANFTALS